MYLHMRILHYYPYHYYCHRHHLCIHLGSEVSTKIRPLPAKLEANASLKENATPPCGLYIKGRRLSGSLVTW